MPHSMHVVEQWFGSHFARLHPLLQQLHRHGGTLAGPVTVTVGSGLAGLMGRTLAKRLGVPTTAGSYDFRVGIGHEDGKLLWSRQFTAPNGRTSRATSLFTAHGHYPDGEWEEDIGAMHFRLGVDIGADGSWHWQPRSASLLGVPLPIALFPRSQAFKRIEDGRYRFQVSFVLPGLGVLLSYGGWLDPLPAPSASPAGNPPP